MVRKTSIRLYVHADEWGQHVSAKHFIVVTIITDQELGVLRRRLRDIEKSTGVGKKKWKKTRSKNRMNFLEQVVDRGIGKDEVYFGIYKKPIPFFMPLLEVMEQGIKHKASGRDYLAKVWVDGIDKKKSQELTSALRVRGISLSKVKSKRDEAEPIIRLADRWAGCIGRGVKKRGVERKLYTVNIGKYFRSVTD